MSYFSDHYGALKYPIADERQAGFRLAQLAAMHAVSAHFFNSKQPAIVTMPTGSGKTTVLMAVAFLLRAQRVLVLTPSRLVREQIAENFRALVDLTKTESIALNVPTPRVFATDRMIGTDAEWIRLREFDVVVATVPSVSKEGVIPDPPEDLFDLVLVDEAHHAPARTRSRLLDLLAQAKQVLFTATPFRRDDKEIKGRFVFSYDLRHANADRVFGDIAFEPVVQGTAPSIDAAIAQAAEAKFRADRAAGLEHLVMVRADTIARAKGLVTLYEQHTRLRMAFVSGHHSLAHVRRIITKLREHDLDGIICVNMFGEGFNLPNLKIAAIHSPHKTLAITLQFIGRFARTGQRNIGQATFLAEPTSSSAEIAELYETGAVWREIVQNLSAGRIQTEIRTREIIDSFAVDAAPDMEDFSLYTVRPYFHAKVFATSHGADLTVEPDFPESLQIIFRGISQPHEAAVYLTREALRSPWSTDERFTNVAYDIFIFHHNLDAGLLFICASRRAAQLYSRLARKLLGDRPRPLSHMSINRALNDLEDVEFFNVGMRKRHRLGRVETYRMIAGPSADKAIQESDGRIFGRGHCFGKALDDGQEITIGVSTASKVWSNTYDRIPELLDWCDRLAGKITSGRYTLTGSRLDILSPGDELERIPAGIIAMRWNPDAYTDTPLAFYHREDGSSKSADLLDFDLTITDSREGSVFFTLSNDDVAWRGRFSLDDGDHLFEPMTEDEPDLVVHLHDEDMTVTDYLNEQMPEFYSSDLSMIEGASIFATPANLELIGDRAFEVVDWAAANVDIRKEKPNGIGQRSIFEWLEERLLGSEAAVVFCDDGPGEIADFIAMTLTEHGPRIQLHHCKASGEAFPGNRVTDLYEICGQAVKSTIWTSSDKLFDRLQHRSGRPSIRGYIKGTQEVAETILTARFRQEVQFEIYVVQPGLRSGDRERAISHLLGATNFYISQGGVDVFGIISS